VNYAELFERIKGYVEDDFPNTTFTDSAGSGTVTLTSTEQINTFIQQAEQRIYNTVELLVSRAVDTGTLTNANPYLAVPAGWLANFSFAVIDGDGNYEYLLNKDVNFIRAAFPNPANGALPTHYAYYNDTEFLLGPTPDDDYAYELQYYRYPESIVTAGTSWVGDNVDSALLYGALLEAYTYMKGEQDVILQYQKRYDEAMILLKQLGEGKNRQDVYRTTQARYPVK
jgi:hypothetical protein